MSTNDLNGAVSAAIIAAEKLPPGTLEAAEAYRTVAALEEQIAARTPVTAAEGAYARVGAVAARMKAGEPIRAVDLAERYLEEPVTDRLRVRLTALRDEAAAALTGAAEVRTKFHLDAA